MAEDLNLVKDLAVILIAAGFFTILSKTLKQPLILGYIVAGFFVGPHLGLFSITSHEAVEQWSEIGIIFLLFALGLEFSFKKLLKVGSSAIIMASTKCVGMFVLGNVAAQMMHWTTMEGIFLGGLMAMSSTTIIIKAFNEMGLKDKPYSTLIFGDLVVEDLIAVLLMVLLSTLAVSGHFEGGKMLGALGRLSFFIILWFLVGIYLVPTVLRMAKKVLNDETLLIVAIGLCFGMVAFAEAVGFSSALGAFVMGSILAETVEGERVEHLLVNIKDLFGAIFFVSVGMMVDPAVIGAHWGTILVITAVVMGGVLIFSSTGALLAGQGLVPAVHAGFSLAQLGEFSFIIASLGCSMGVMRDFIYPSIISVSVITTFTTPYMIKAAEPVAKWLQKRLPERILDKINPTAKVVDIPLQDVGESHWRGYLKQYILRVVLYSVVLIALMVGASLLIPKLEALLSGWNVHAVKLLELGGVLSLLYPLVYGLTAKPKAMRECEEALLERNRTTGFLIVSLDVLRIFIAVALVCLTLVALFDFGSWVILLLIVLAVIVAITVWRRMHKGTTRIESRFFENLEATEKLARQRTPVATSVREKLQGYNVRIEGINLSPDSQYVGLTLRELPFRHTTGINIIKIQRGRTSIITPGGDERIYPFDRLLAVGTDAQVQAFLTSMKGETIAANPYAKNVGNADDFVVETFLLEDNSPMTGRSLRELDMRSFGCMIISLLRESEFIANPPADFVFAAGDYVWLAGLSADLTTFMKHSPLAVEGYAAEGLELRSENG